MLGIIKEKNKNLQNDLRNSQEKIENLAEEIDKLKKELELMMGEKQRLKKEREETKNAIDTIDLEKLGKIVFFLGKSIGEEEEILGNSQFDFADNEKVIIKEEIKNNKEYKEKIENTIKTLETLKKLNNSLSNKLKEESAVNEEDKSDVVEQLEVSSHQALEQN